MTVRTAEDDGADRTNGMPVILDDTKWMAVPFIDAEEPAIARKVPSLVLGWKGRCFSAVVCFPFLFVHLSF